MARINNDDIQSKNVPLYGWGLSLDLTGKGHAIAKRVWDTYEHLAAYVNDSNDSALAGNILAVVDDTTNNGVYFVKAIKGINSKGEADATVTETEIVKLGDAGAVGDVSKALADLATRVTTAEGKIATNEAAITALQDALAALDTKYVPLTRTIAGLALDADITAEDLKNALGVADLDFIKGVQVNGKDLTIDEDKKVNITAKDLGLDSALHFKGKIEGSELPAVKDYQSGDVILLGSKEYILSDGAWVELGDEGSYALKTVRVVAGEGLEGGGALSGDVTINLKDVESTSSTGEKAVLSDTAVDVVTGVEVNAKGQVTAVAKTPIAIPGLEAVSTSADYLNATVKDVEGKKEISVGVTVAGVADGAKGLAEATDVKSYVDEQIAAVSGEIATADVKGSDYVTVTTATEGVKSTYTVNAEIKPLAAASSEAKGLAEASDVKGYVDAQVAAVKEAIDYTTVANEGTYITVSAAADSRDYKVAANTAVVSTVSAAGSLADAKDVKDYVDGKETTINNNIETKLSWTEL